MTRAWGFNALIDKRKTLFKRFVSGCMLVGLLMGVSGALLAQDGIDLRALSAGPVAGTRAADLSGLPQREAVAAEFWLRPRTAQSVLQQAAVRHSLLAWLALPKAEVLIHFPGGEEGRLAANELRDWLVAVGVASRFIVLSPGVTEGEQLELEVRALRR